MSIIDIMAKMIGGVLQESLMDQIRLETMADDQTMVLKDGSLASIIHVAGALRSPGEQEVAENVDNLRVMLSPYFSRPGHSLEINFMRDPSSAKSYIERVVGRVKRNARRLSLDLDDVLQERVKNLSSRMVNEICLITVVTRPSVLEREESKEDAEAIAKRMADMPSVEDGQIPGKYLEAAFSRHESLVEALNSGLQKADQVCRVLSVKEALQEVRAGLYPETYSEKDEWNPILPLWSQEGKKDPDVHPGKRSLVMMPETPAQLSGYDYGNMGTPTFDYQLATEDSYIETTRSVRIGNMIFSGFDMTVAPEVLPDFNSLVADITAKDKGTPWRTSMRIDSGGSQSQHLKLMYLSIFAWSSPTRNNRIREALLINNDIDGQTDNIVRFRMSFSTWAPMSKPNLLRRRAQIVTGAVKRWGNSGVDGISGDPMATVVSTLPGVTTASTAPSAAGPLSDILSMLPLARQASPWDNGSVMFQTKSGKPWTYEPGSSKQNTWVSLIVGTPGSGKSVLMNAVNFATALSPSAVSGDEPVLPRIAIIDIGPSSAGLISLLQEALPAHRRHEALFQKLKNDRDFAINVMDTQPGMRKPMSGERTFLINFLSLIMSNGDKPPSGPMSGLISASIDMAYEMFMDHKSPRRYIRNDQPAVDAVLDELGFEETPETIWWEVVDFLMEHGRIAEVIAAQRQAVPTLSDLVTASQEDQIRSIYGDAEDPETKQPLLTAFQRVISEVVRDYPILSTYTRYSIGSARVVSMDLMGVTARGSGAAARKQTSIMYMLARQVLTRDFFLDSEEIENMVARGDLPDIYKEYHMERAAQMINMPKILCMDEYHRCGSIEAVNDQLLQDAREGRKFKVDIKVASQLIEDFPKAIIEVATTLIVCNAGSENSITYLDEMYRLTDNEKAILRHNLNGPSSRGTPIWVLFKTKEQGQVRQELLLTIGPAELWAFSTTADDVALRTALYSELGPKATRQVLAAKYPHGSAKRDIDARIARMEELSERGEEAQHSVMDDLIKELKEQSYIMNK
jgi:intracellular multiplication protein IcmB